VETPAAPTHPVSPTVRIAAEASFLKALNTIDPIPFETGQSPFGL
jgi:hypothetical protein